MLATAVAGFLFFTLPASKLYWQMYSWISGMFFFSGLHGKGNKSFLDTELIFTNCLKFVESEPIIVFILVFSIIFMAWAIIRERSLKQVNLILILVFVQIFQLVIIFKHYRDYYFLPLLPSLAVNIVVMMEITGLRRKPKTAIIIAFIGLCFGLNHNFRKYRQNSPVAVGEPGCINLFSYPRKSVYYALKYGDQHANSAHANLLEQVYGPQYFYNLWTKEISGWRRTVPLDSLLRSGSTIYLFAQPKYLRRMPPPFILEKISAGKYLVKTNDSRR